MPSENTARRGRKAKPLVRSMTDGFAVSAQAQFILVCVRLVASKEVLKGNAPLTSGKQGVALQAANFALRDVTNLNRDDLVFRLASWADEGDRF